MDFLSKHPDITKDGKLDHFDIFSKVQNYISSEFSKAIKYRMHGGHGLQSVVYDGSLKDMVRDEKTGKVTPAQIKVPEEFAEVGAEIISSRIPNSDFMTNIVAVVAGHTGKGGNVVEVPPGFISASDSDLDGDGLYMMKQMPDAKTDLDKQKNVVHEILWDLMTDKDVWERYQNNLDVAPLKESVDKTDAEMGVKKSTSPIGSVIGSLDMDQSLKESGALIGAFAVGSKLMDVLAQSGASLLPKKEIYLWGKKKSRFTNERKAANALFLQLALDDTNELYMGKTGITLDNAGVVNTLLNLGYSQEDVMKFVKHPAIAKLTENLRQRRMVHTQDKPASEHKIIQDAIDGIVTENKARASEGKGNRMIKGSDVLELLNIYNDLHKVSQVMRNVSKVIQIDKGAPKDIISLYHTIGAFDRIREQKIVNMGAFFERPLVQKHEQLLYDLKGVFDDFFSFSLSDADINKEFSGTIFSFTNTKSQKDVGYHIRKTQTELIAQRMAYYQYSSAELASEFLDAFAEKVIRIKNAGITEANQWFSLVRFDQMKKRLVPNDETGIPELGGAEDSDVNRKFVEDSFKKLSKKIQKEIIDYAIYSSGLKGGKFSITNLVPDKVFADFFKELKGFKIGEDFFDEIAKSGIEDIGSFNGDTRYGIKSFKIGEDISFKKDIPSVKYFTLSENDNLFLYKIDPISKTATSIYISTEEHRANIASGETLSMPIFESTRDTTKEQNPVVIMSEIEIAQEPEYTTINENISTAEEIGGLIEEEPSIEAERVLDTKSTRDTENNIVGKEFTFYVGENRETGEKLEHRVVINDATLTVSGDWRISATNLINGRTYDMTTNEVGNVLSYRRKGKIHSRVITDEVIFPEDAFVKYTEGESGVDLQKRSVSNPEAVRGLRRTLRRLRNKFGINYRVINDPTQNFAGAYDRKTGEVIINEAFAGADTPFHEFAHPFIAAVKKNNKALYKKLVAELQSSEEGKAVLDGVKEAYPELKLEEQLEEAIVELIGREAADSIQDQTLGELIRSLLKQVATYLKKMFGNKSDVIPSQIDPNTTLGDLAKMLSNEASIETDEGNDTRVKRALTRNKAKIQNMLNDAYQIVSYAKLLSPKARAIRSTLSESGFLLNDTMIIKEKQGLVDTIHNPVAVRVPNGMTDWFGEIKDLYPAADIHSKEYSGMLHYERYLVNLGEGRQVAVYKPTSPKAGSLSDSYAMNLQFSKDSSQKSMDKEADYNRNESVMDGHSFPRNIFTVTGKTITPGIEAARRRFYQDMSEKVGEGDSKEVVQSLERSTVENMINNVQVEMLGLSQDKKKGSLAKAVDFKFVQLNEHDRNTIVSMVHEAILKKNSDVLQTMDPAIQKMYDNFVKSYTILEYLKSTKDAFVNMDNNGNINTMSVPQVAGNIIESVKEVSEKRNVWMDKHPIFKTIWNRIVKPFSGIFKQYWMGTMTPKVFSNIMAGDKQGFLKSLIYDSFWKGEQKQYRFAKDLHQIVLKAYPDKGQMDSKVGKISRINGKKDHELDMMSVKIMDKDARAGSLEKSFNMPIARAVSLYMVLRQEDVYEKYYNSSDGSYTINFGDIDMGGASGSLLQPRKDYRMTLDQWNSFKAQMEASEHMTLINQLTKMFSESGKMLNPAVRGHIGTDLDLVENYYPVTTSRRNMVGDRTSAKKLEDFRFFKQRTKNAQATLGIEDAMESVEFYIRETSNYHGYAEPVVNIRKLIDEFQKQVESHPEYSPMIEYMQDIADSIQDYSLLGGTTDTKAGKVVQGMMNKFQLAVLGLNPSVALKQPVSMTAAAAELGREIFGSKYRKAAARVMKGVLDVKLGKDSRVGKLDLDNPDIVRMLDVSEIMEQRLKGYIDREQGEYRSAGMTAYSESGKKSKIFGVEMDLSKTMELIKIMDAATITAIFVRVEDEIDEQHRNITKDRRKALIKKRFEQVVNDTQPTYSVLNRTKFGRAKHQFIRIFTMFSSQRAKNANMMIDALNRMMVDPSYANQMKFRSTLFMVGLISALSISVIMGSFYGAGQAYGGIMTNKPWDAINHPVIQISNEVLDVGKYVKNGDLIKGADKAILSGFKLTGLPVYPYARARAALKGGGTDNTKSKKSTEPKPKSKDKTLDMPGIARDKSSSARVLVDQPGKKTRFMTKGEMLQIKRTETTKVFPKGTTYSVIEDRNN
jgi:hypothetical protein